MSENYPLKTYPDDRPDLPMVLAKLSHSRSSLSIDLCHQVDEDNKISKLYIERRCGGWLILVTPAREYDDCNLHVIVLDNGHIKMMPDGRADLFEVVNRVPAELDNPSGLASNFSLSEWLAFKLDRAYGIDVVQAMRRMNADEADAMQCLMTVCLEQDTDGKQRVCLRPGYWQTPLAIGYLVCVALAEVPLAWSQGESVTVPSARVADVLCLLQRKEIR